uniref:Large ribosomal subunit protein bL12c n=2 Tax=Scytosiphon TaxID=27966 RepID=A0A7T8G477_SCYLO|nr:50S ribosomal protein L12 [Scytosiphon promiscuus]YP_010147391.1 50S ribosomal protein L12 [Scytosiphon lomentaria]QDM58291.1 50S ribosomal protein L12 [Scytosiphon promiscuus]QDM58434.1 50S ribosomal protein L12 [Scytosiphon promiscuus]QQP22185.1 50S ribosomal protein L12 [Scytosiphon lomentaria]QTW91514.1 ribosomal protein L12 [Scytosiphon lomentaria]WAM64529.1 50S ribosomal protein L12 [Scytosiphon lomentaria]
MTEKISNLIEEFKTLTLLEAAELVKAIEETFDVDASAGGGVMMMNAGAGTSEDNAGGEEKTEFDVSLDEVPKDKKISILKIVRSVTELGLKEAKEVVENTPKVIKEGLTKAAAEETKKVLEEAGAVVTLK